MNVIVIRLHVFLQLILAPPPKRSAGQAGVKGAKCTILQKSGFYTKKSLTNRNNQDSAITYYVKLLVVMYLHWYFWKIGCLSSPCSKILKILHTQKSPNVLYEVDHHSQTIVNWSMELVYWRVLGHILNIIHLIQPSTLGRLWLGASKFSVLCTSQILTRANLYLLKKYM